MIWAFSILGLLALSGLPLFLVLSGVAVTGFLHEGLNPAVYFAEIMRLTSNPTLIAIPLFTFAGYLLAESNAPRRLVTLADALLGWLPGGLGIVTVLVMALLTAFTGASGVTIVALGGLMLPTLLKSGYSERFSLGLLTSSGSIGLLFPPSLPLIIFAIIAEVPVDKLFSAGIVPGLMLVSGIALYAIYQGYRTKQRSARLHEGGVQQLLRNALWEVPLPIIVVGGIYTGLFTAVEAAVATVVYLLLVESVILRDVKYSRLPGLLIESSIMVGGILLILGSAMALTNYLIFADIPTNLLNWISSTLHSKWSFLLALNLFLLIVGCLMDVFSALVVVVPLILPLALQYGVDPLHLGVIFLMNLEIGYTTPPVGLNLFIASYRFKRPIVELYRAALPFLAIQLIILAIVTYLPIFSLWLPTILAKGH